MSQGDEVDSDLYPEGGGNPGGLWAEDGHHLIFCLLGEGQTIERQDSTSTWARAVVCPGPSAPALTLCSPLCSASGLLHVLCLLLETLWLSPSPLSTLLIHYFFQEASLDQSG